MEGNNLDSLECGTYTYSTTTNNNNGLSKTTENGSQSDKVIYKLRDRNLKMVAEWDQIFQEEIKKGLVQVSQGDIFKGAPSADAIVSPANSFGFMDGGIDMAYSMHFGWQMQERLQKIIREEHHGEILVGQAVIIPTFEGGAKQDSMKWKGYNEDQPIKYLISAPTMRTPQFVDETVNAYLAFRAVILAVNKFNRSNKDKITSVLCPGLGTAVGRMPHDRCAFQIKEAYDTFVMGLNPKRICPPNLAVMSYDMDIMQEFKRPHESDEDTDDKNEHSLNRRLNIKPSPKPKRKMNH